MENIKIERYNDAIQEELSKILMTEVKDEAIHFVTITGCDLSSDLSYCKIYFTVLDPEKKDSTLQALNKAKGFLRTELSQRIEIRHTPELRFVYDESIAYGEHMDKILSQVKEEENEREDSSK